jgi:hypothetical protein
MPNRDCRAMDKKLCSKESDTEYRRLSVRVLRWNEVSNIDNSLFGDARYNLLEKIFATDGGNRYWQATRSRPNSSKIFTKFRRNFNEERRIEHLNAQHYGTPFHLLMSHSAVSDSTCSISSCEFPYLMIKYTRRDSQRSVIKFEVM